MKCLIHIVITMLLVAVPVIAQQGPIVPETAEGEQDQFNRVQVNVTVTDANGNPLPRLMVQAMAVGRDASQSLTDKDGKCGMTLRPGSWVVKVSRSNLDVLLRLELEVGDREKVDLPLTIRADNNGIAGSDSGNEVLGDGLLIPQLQANDRTANISATNLETTGAQAAAELSLFTDTVLREARQKILDQYESKKFSTSYWIDNNMRGNSSLGTDADFRLDIDWQGNVVGAGGNAAGQRNTVSLLTSNSALLNVPVNVNIDVATSRVSEYRGMFDFGKSGNTSGNQNIPNPGGTLNQLTNRFGSFLTGGSQSPESAQGFDFGARANLTAQSNNNFRAFYNEINNHIINLYRPLRAAFNQAVGPTDAVRGVELGVEKTFIYGLRAKVRYNYSEAGGLDIRTVDFYFEDWQDFETFLQQGIRRDLSTTLEARFSDTGTQLAANYRMYISDLETVGFSDRVSDLVSEHSRIDLSLNQKINFGILSSARISFSLAVNNLLNNSRSSFLGPDLEEDFNNRKYLGGIRIEF